MKYFVKMHTGDRYEVDELDYNHINHRIGTGRTNGFYQIRGKINPSLKFAFQYFMLIETEGTPKPKDEIVRDIDEQKLKMPEVGKLKVTLPDSCHSWDKEETWHYVQQNVGGKTQYRKECNQCKKVSPLVKPKEVQNQMEAEDSTLEEVKVRA